MMKTLFRAAVMLAFLVGGPAAWIYYGPLPPRQQAAVDRLIAAAKTAWKDADAAPTASPLAHGAGLEAAPPFASLAGVGDAAAQRSDVAKAVEPTSAAVASPTIESQVAPLLAQLRQRGAAEYSLEQWGASGDLFRFCCAVPLADADDHCRQFEAIGSDPRLAVEQVLAEASAWQNARGEVYVR